MHEQHRARRGHRFFPTEADALPALYETDGQGRQAVARVRYFGPGASQWIITEYDPTSGEAFGYCELFAGGGELGYVSLVELEQVQVGPLRQVVERDLHFQPAPLEAIIL